MVSLLLLGAALAAATPTEAAKPPELPGWLAGGWIMQSDSGSWSEEWWTPAKGGIMLGAGRSGKADKTDWWEQTRIERHPDGKITFCALPKGQAGACFTATKASATEITFENPQHDFPTRVEYRREGDQLHAEISGPNGSNPQRWRFTKLN